MISIPIMMVANQSLTFADPDSVLWEIAIKTAINSMCADIVRDGVTILRGQRIVADAPIIPYKYLSTQGNFTILSNNGDLPWWEEFGDTQQLIYLTADEVGA